MMHTAFLLIGGNLGERENNLQQAAQLIEAECGDIISISSVYETAAWGFTDQPAFLNQVLVLNTEMEAEALMRTLLHIEHEMGRTRGQKLGPRLIDIDILLFDNLVHHSADLTLPHPAMHLRRFALVPLAEVAATKHHPLLNKTITELLTDCPDTLAVKKIS
jgi:2-amino-4-hydroxy-6-hydroxymethyldihydropteridine diphosphokinase